VGSDLDATPFFATPPQIKLGPNKRRPPQRRENATRPRRLPADRPGHGRAQPRRLRPLLGQPAPEAADKLAVSLAAKHLEADKPPLTEARAIVLDGALLRSAHDQPPRHFR
jgi:hypothetical protein